MSFKGFSIFSSGGHFVQWSFSNFGRETLNEYFCEIILKSVHWSWRRCHLKMFLFLALVAILFSGADRFSHFCEIFFLNRAIGLGGDVI